MGGFLNKTMFKPSVHQHIWLSVHKNWTRHDTIMNGIGKQKPTVLDKQPANVSEVGDEALRDR